MPRRRSRRRIAGGAVAGLVVVLLVAYAVLSAHAGRLLAPQESATFALAVLRAAPAPFGSSSPLEVIRLGGEAFGRPATQVSLMAGGARLTLPLPPRTTPADGDQFVTFASGAERHAYLHETLPAAGWRYVEQLGSVHLLERGSWRLAVSQRFQAGTRVVLLAFHAEPARIPAAR